MRTLGSTAVGGGDAGEVEGGDQVVGRGRGQVVVGCSSMLAASPASSPETASDACDGNDAVGQETWTDRPILA